MRTRNSERHKIPTIQNRVLKGGRRDIAERKLNVIDGEIFKEKENKDKKPKLGARRIFLESLTVNNGDINKAKEELKNNGFSLETYNDNILKSWRDEDRNR